MIAPFDHSAARRSQVVVGCRLANVNARCSQRDTCAFCHFSVAVNATRNREVGSSLVVALIGRVETIRQMDKVLFADIGIEGGGVTIFESTPVPAPAPSRIFSDLRFRISCLVAAQPRWAGSQRARGYSGPRARRSTGMKMTMRSGARGRHSRSATLNSCCRLTGLCFTRCRSTRISWTGSEQLTRGREGAAG